MTSTEIKTLNPESSDWSVTQPASSHHRNCLTMIPQYKDKFPNNTQDNNINQDQSKKKQEKNSRLASPLSDCCFSCAPILYGILLGVLSAGLILAIIIALWLTSDNTRTLTKATTIETTTSSSTISSSTTSLSTSTTTTTTTTANPCGIPTPIGTASAIYSATTGPSSYHCHYFAWTASTTGNVTLAFQFENDPDQWNMDDVSVTDGTHALLLNGGFESGSFSPGWQISEPNGACSWSTTGASIVRSSCRTGNYCFSDGCGSVSDELSQSFLVTAGQVYYISFWLEQSGGSQSGISVDVTLS